MLSILATAFSASFEWVSIFQNLKLIMGPVLINKNLVPFSLSIIMPIWSENCVCNPSKHWARSMCWCATLIIRMRRFTVSKSSLLPNLSTLFFLQFLNYSWSDSPTVITRRCYVAELPTFDGGYQPDGQEVKTSVQMPWVTKWVRKHAGMACLYKLCGRILEAGEDRVKITTSRPHVFVIVCWSWVDVIPCNVYLSVIKFNRRDGAKGGF